MSELGTTKRFDFLGLQTVGLGNKIIRLDAYNILESDSWAYFINIIQTFNEIAHLSLSVIESIPNQEFENFKEIDVSELNLTHQIDGPADNYSNDRFTEPITKSKLIEDLNYMIYRTDYNQHLAYKFKAMAQSLDHYLETNAVLIEFSENLCNVFWDCWKWVNVIIETRLKGLNQRYLKFFNFEKDKFSIYDFMRVLLRDSLKFSLYNTDFPNIDRQSEFHASSLLGKHSNICSHLSSELSYLHDHEALLKLSPVYNEYLQSIKFDTQHGESFSSFLFGQRLYHLGIYKESNKRPTSKVMNNNFLKIYKVIISILKNLDDMDKSIIWLAGNILTEILGGLEDDFMTSREEREAKMEPHVDFFKRIWSNNTKLTIELSEMYGLLVVDEDTETIDLYSRCKDFNKLILSHSQNYKEMITIVKDHIKSSDEFPDCINTLFPQQFSLYSQHLNSLFDLIKFDDEAASKNWPVDKFVKSGDMRVDSFCSRANELTKLGNVIRVNQANIKIVWH